MIPTPSELSKITNETQKRLYNETLERLKPYIDDVSRQMYKAATSGKSYVYISFANDPYRYEDYRFVIDYFQEKGFSTTTRTNDSEYIIQW